MSDPIAARELEAVIPVASAHALRLLDPAALDAWLVSEVEVDGSRVSLCIQEEYGYRRHVAATIARRDEHRLELEVDAVEREWDGSDGTPVGPASAPSRWRESGYDGTVLEVVVDAGIAIVRWRGFGDGALDATRRQGVLLRHGVERAIEAFGRCEAEPVVAERALAASAATAWRTLAAPEPGARWIAPDGLGGGRVLLAVSGRRLAASWHDPRSGLPVGLLDVRIGHDRSGDGCSVQVTIDAPNHAGTAPAWAAGCADAIAAATATSGPRAGA